MKNYIEIKNLFSERKKERKKNYLKKERKKERKKYAKFFLEQVKKEIIFLLSG